MHALVLRCSLAIVLGLSTIAACSSSDGLGEVSVDASLNLCRAGTCTFVPAADARVKILLGDEVIASGALGRDGRYTTRLAPATYRVEVTMPTLDISASDQLPNLNEGAAVELSMVLPDVRIVPSR
jgi:hypothetical protein